MLGSFFYARETIPPSKKCYGRMCWQNTLLCTSLLSAVACALAAVVVQMALRRAARRAPAHELQLRKHADDDVNTEQNLLDDDA